MMNGFDRLRHNTIVCCHYQDYQIGRLCTACTHCGKCLVAWCIEKGYYPLRCFYMIGAHVLRNAASFTARYPRLADMVEQRCLAMIHVTHDGDDRRARFSIGSDLRRIC